MKKHIIWSNQNINVEDWQDFLDECYPDVTDEFDKYNLCAEMNDEYLYDERANLDIDLDDEIIVIGDLGLWHGRVQGYKIIKSGNIKDCLYTSDCDYVTWYVDGKMNLRFSGAHHDGNNYYLYRTWRENLSDTQKENFLEKIYMGKATKNDISRYTKRIGDKVCAVYGW